ncbi:MAG: RNA-binding protein [Candidatus Diapherotrites archaeon]|nr:RNA-binding protein [Candidatus Diapherotrites archaeon]
MNAKIVIPGEEIESRGKKIGSNVYTRNGRSYSAVLGLLNENETYVKVVPLAGKYMPKEDDLVLGLVEDVKYAGAFLDISSVNSAFLPATEMGRNDDPKAGDLILARVSEVDEVNSARLISGSIVGRGKVIEVSSAKIPRVLGTKKSMLNLLKDKTGCKIIVGMNGRIWVQGENAPVVILAIRKIEEEAHKSGLTNKIETFLEKEIKKEKKSD